MSERQVPKLQGLYVKKFHADKIYQVIALAQEEKTGREMVVYQAMFGRFSMYVGALEEFEETMEAADMAKEEEEKCEEELPNKDLMEFLEADSYEQQRNILIHMRPRITDSLIDIIAASMDLTVEEGDIDTRYFSLLRCIQTKQKYEKMDR